MQVLAFVIPIGTRGSCLVKHYILRWEHILLLSAK